MTNNSSNITSKSSTQAKQVRRNKPLKPLQSITSNKGAARKVQTGHEKPLLARVRAFKSSWFEMVCGLFGYVAATSKRKCNNFKNYLKKEYCLAGNMSEFESKILEGRFTQEDVDELENILKEQDNISKIEDEKREKKEKQEKILKEKILKKAKTNPDLSKKVQFICRNKLSTKKLKKLEESVDILFFGTNDPKDEVAAYKFIDQLCFSDWMIINESINREEEEYRTDIFINERAKFIASLLIASQGKIDKDMISIIEDLLDIPPLMQRFSRTYSSVLKETLNTIKNNEQFINLLNGLGEPGKNLSKSDPNKRRLEYLIRSTLGLNEKTPLTALHSKQALLSALLTDLRQGNIGSCFASSIAIMVHDQNPLQMAIELKGIIENGKFEKTINREIVTFNIPQIYIPFPEFQGPEITDLGPDAFMKFLKNPGIKKVAAMAGLDTSNEKNSKLLSKMFNDVLESLGDHKLEEDLIRLFINQLVMHKIGLDPDDFEKKAEYEAKVREEEKLLQGREESQQRYAGRVGQLHQEMDEINNYFDKKFGKNISLKDKFEAIDEFQQNLEMHYLAAIGENTLSRIWEYSIASKGASSFLDLLINWLTVTPTSTAQDKENIFDPRINVTCILDDVLNTIKVSNSTFNKKQFKKEFNQNFKNILTQQLQIRYEGGRSIFYDKTRAKSMNLAIRLEGAEELRASILSMAYQAAETITVHNLSIKDEVMKKLGVEIVRLQFFNGIEDFYSSAPEEGGESTAILKKYSDTPFEAKEISNDPVDFILTIVTQLNSMIENGTLNNDPISQIIFPMNIKKHACLFRPDMKMLAEIIEDPSSEAVKAWLAKNLIDKKSKFVVGDLNWKRLGAHVHLAIKYNQQTSRWEFIQSLDNGRSFRNNSINIEDIVVNFIK